MNGSFMFGLPQGKATRSDTGTDLTSSIDRGAYRDVMDVSVHPATYLSWLRDECNFWLLVFSQSNRHNRTHLPVTKNIIPSLPNPRTKAAAKIRNAPGQQYTIEPTEQDLARITL